ncbi:NUDIX hydrolase [Phytoactinopolyspora limicola]|uniref:NUDIX hydrolase n=1 Tax=Phytoactinopolyspora limicola TaxID=2715536 RepID=UPI001A9C81F2|nr:NUDIX domain-containing protein [Phytoactinopolyspora limicola]
MPSAGVALKAVDVQADRLAEIVGLEYFIMAEPVSNDVDADDVFLEWEQDADGVWTRRAARVIVVAHQHVLLLRGFDVSNPGRSWWFTPGGGIDADESPRAAAAREVFEESGLRLDPADLVGPVARRCASFPYFGRPCRQEELLYYACVGAAESVTTTGWTAVEQVSVTELAWWPLDELAATQQTVYPPELPALVRTLVADGWDGTTRTID